MYPCVLKYWPRTKELFMHVCYTVLETGNSDSPLVSTEADIEDGGVGL